MMSAIARTDRQTIVCQNYISHGKASHWQLSCARSTNVRIAANALITTMQLLDSLQVPECAVDLANAMSEAIPL
jgi:hypothetical protein